MKFLVDRCAGRRIAEWLDKEGHDVIQSRDLGADPGDRELLRIAASEGRAVVTIDSDFGTLIFRDGQSHCGMIRLPDVASEQRIELMRDLLQRYSVQIASGAIITVRGGRIRVSYVPDQDVDEDESATDEE